MTYNQKSEVLNKCCNPDDIYYICLTDFHNKFPVHNSDRYSHVALCQQDMTDSLFSQVQSRIGKIHDMVGIYFVLDKFLKLELVKKWVAKSRVFFQKICILYFRE